MARRHVRGEALTNKTALLLVAASLLVGSVCLRWDLVLVKLEVTVDIKMSEQPVKR